MESLGTKDRPLLGTDRQTDNSTKPGVLDGAKLKWNGLSCMDHRVLDESVS